MNVRRQTMFVTGCKEKTERATKRLSRFFEYTRWILIMNHAERDGTRVVTRENRKTNIF